MKLEMSEERDMMDGDLATINNILGRFESNSIAPVNRLHLQLRRIRIRLRMSHFTPLRFLAALFEINAVAQTCVSVILLPSSLYVLLFVVLSYLCVFQYK